MREDAQKLREEKTTLEGMIQSRDELILEMAEEYGLNCMGENGDDEDEDDDDEGNAIAPLAPVPAAVPEEIDEEGPVEAIPEQEAPVLHQVIPADAEAVMPQLHPYHALMRDYEENPPRMEDDFDDLDDYPSGGRFDVDE